MQQTHFYLRDRKGHPIGVVAMRPEGIGVRVAVSLCAATDDWCKNTGIAKAYDRLDSADESLVCTDDRTEITRILHGLLSPPALCRADLYRQCERIYDVDCRRADDTWRSQYARLTTPRRA